jgi:hypothetical protein
VERRNGFLIQKLGGGEVKASRMYSSVCCCGLVVTARSHPHTQSFPPCKSRDDDGPVKPITDTQTNKSSHLLLHPNRSPHVEAGSRLVYPIRSLDRWAVCDS